MTVVQQRGHLIDGIEDRLFVLIAEHEDRNLRAFFLKRPAGVVFAVAARENRNQNADLRAGLTAEVILLTLLIADRQRLRFALAVNRIERTKRSHPGGQHFVLAQFQFIDAVLRLGLHFADHRRALIRKLRRNFRDDQSRLQLQKLLTALDGKAQAVAEAHLEQGCQRAAFFSDIGGNDRALTDPFADRLKHRLITGQFRQSLFTDLRFEDNQTVARGFQLRGNDIFCLRIAAGKGNQRRHDVLVVKRAGHTVLAADRGLLEIVLHLHCA